MLIGLNFLLVRIFLNLWDFLPVYRLYEFDDFFIEISQSLIIDSMIYHLKITSNIIAPGVRSHFEIRVHRPCLAPHCVLKKLLVFWCFWSWVSSVIISYSRLLLQIFTAQPMFLDALSFDGFWILSLHPLVPGIWYGQGTASLPSKVIGNHRLVLFVLLLDGLKPHLG